MCAGGVEEGAFTFDICKALVDEWVTVTEREIAEAMVGLREAEGIVVEGSAGVAMASYIKQRKQYAGKSVALVCCGGNVLEASYAKAAQLLRV